MLAWRYWLVAHGAGEAYLTMATDTRADAILVGCLTAFLVNPGADLAPRAMQARDVLVGGACLLVLLASVGYRDDDFRLTARYTVQSLAIAPLILLSIRHAAHAPFRWLNARPMVYVGTVSYTIYLSHQVVLYGVMRHAPQLGEAATLAVTVLVTLLVAEAARRWIERPFVQLRKRLQPTSVRFPNPEFRPVVAAP
jgi:peptidoglycan/LPS O-acetylase OafA/YrhL